MGLHLCTKCNLHQPYEYCTLCSAKIFHRTKSPMIGYLGKVLAIVVIAAVLSVIQGQRAILSKPGYWIASTITAVVIALILQIPLLIKNTHNSESKHG